ncbi:MAG: hypothetical protein ABIP75_18310 [Pyrinomonadaceae bacterium]
MNQPVVIVPDVTLRFREMAEDQLREREALEWSEGTLDGVENERKVQLPSDVPERLNEVYSQSDSRRDGDLAALHQVSFPIEKW